MNNTAKKLREAAGCEYASVWNMISALRGRMGIEERDTYNNDLSAILTAIADELDELEAKAPTEKERRILDMWPKFEDSEPVMIGDEATNNKNQRFTVKRIEFRHGKWMLNDSVTDGHYLNGKSGKRVERPAPKVLDADGVEIKVGDTVYEPNGQSGIVAAVHPSTRCVDLRQDGCDAYAMDTKRLTHTRPDSWKRLFADASDDACAYFGRYDENGSARCVGCPAEHAECCTGTQMDDLIRRVKALAGIEVG